MPDLKEKRKFQAVWTAWKKYLSAMVEAKGGKLLCPVAEDISFIELPTGYSAQPKWPICFKSLPQKGNSGSSSHKLVVFINGSFTFENDEENPAESYLISADSNVAFFKPNTGTQTITLSLLDAYHFDHFAEDPKTSMPHPVFHAQRNIRGDDLFPKFFQSLVSDHQNNMVIGELDQAVKNKLFGHKTFKVPTPQMDLFSLSAIIAADHLVENCSPESIAYKNFRAFLKYISAQQPAMVNVRHQQAVKAKAADAANRFVWQWYSNH